ncbi:unnamed protein product, partial [Amoebophrya sp. A25]
VVNQNCLVRTNCYNSLFVVLLQKHCHYRKTSDISILDNIAQISSITGTTLKHLSNIHSRQHRARRCAHTRRSQSSLDLFSIRTIRNTWRLSVFQFIMYL